MSASSTRGFDERRWAAILVIAALAVRGSWILELASLPWGEQLPTDCFVYDQAARRIASGDLLLGHQPLRMSPGYFWALGLVHAVLGSGPWGIRVVQALGGAMTVLLTWRLARRLVRPPLAIAAAALVAFSGPLVFFDGAVLPESLSALALVGSILLVTRALEAEPERRWPRAALAGLSLGALALLRPNAVLLIPVAAGLVASTRGARSSRAGAVAALVVAACLAIAPVTARNYVATGRLVPLTSHGGVNLFVGNGPGATGAFRVPDEAPGADSPTSQFEAFRAAASRELGREVDEVEADRHWQRRTLDAVLADPPRWLALFARKLHLVFNARELGLVLSYAFARECSSTMGAPLVQTGWIAPLALVSLLLSLVRRRDGSAPPGPPRPGAGEAERALAWLTATFVVSVALVFVSDRYRAPLVPPFAVLAALLADRAHDAARAGATRWLGLVGTALALAAALAWPVPATPHFENEWAKLGQGFLEDEEPARALASFDRALALDPRWLPARVGRARALSGLGRRDEARTAWREVLGEPGLPEALRAEATRGAAGSR